MLVRFTVLCSDSGLKIHTVEAKATLEAELARRSHTFEVAERLCNDAEMARDNALEEAESTRTLVSELRLLLQESQVRLSHFLCVGGSFCGQANLRNTVAQKKKLENQVQVRCRTGTFGHVT